MVFGRYLHLVDKNPARTGKIGKNLARKLDFKDIKFSCQNQRYSQNIEKNCKQHQCFWLWEQRKISVLRLKKYFKRHVDLLLIEKNTQFYYFFIRYFHIFMCNQTLHIDKKRCYSLQSFSLVLCKGIRKNMSFSLDNKLVSIDSFQVLSQISLDS